MAGADIHDAGAARAHSFCLSSRVLAFLGYSFMFGVVAFTAVALATGLVGGGEDSPRLNERSPWHESCSVFCSGDLLRRVQARLRARAPVRRMTPSDAQRSWLGFSTTVKASWTRP